MINIRFDEAKAELAGWRIIDLIRKATKAGVSTTGEAFAPYSEHYALWRAKKKKKATPNLTDTGNTLAALLPNANSTGISIEFTQEEEARIASYHEVVGAGKNKVVRKFLGLRPADYEDSKLLKLLREAIVIEEV